MIGEDQWHSRLHLAALENGSNFLSIMWKSLAVSDVQVCHQRKDTTLMVFDLILNPTLNLAPALALAL